MGIGALGFDSQGISCFNCPGPIKIVGCCIEASTINFLIGGVVPDIPGVNTHDVEYRRNFHWKRNAWNEQDPAKWTLEDLAHSRPGYFWAPDNVRGMSVKNLFELKWGVRVLVEACVFRDSWSDDQNFGIVIKTENSIGDGESGGNSTARCQHVVMRHCYMDHVFGAFDLIGKGFGGLIDNHTSHVELHNWLVTNVGGDDQYKTKLVPPPDDFPADPCTIQMSENFNHFIADHLTIALTPDAHTHFGLAIRYNYGGYLKPTQEWQNNIFAVPVTGQTLFATGYPTALDEGTATLQTMSDNAYTFVDNLLVNALQNGKPYPAASAYPTTIAGVGFTNYAADDLRLATGTTYKGSCADGSDPGYLHDRLTLAISGVAS
jgi:hypothetical protein